MPVRIHGKEYATVSERLSKFRKDHPDWSLLTEVVTLEPDHCCLRAVVKDVDGRELATGMAFERVNGSQINRTSHVENCETSAWGRALANLGYDPDAAVASAEEMALAIERQAAASHGGGNSRKTPTGRPKNTDTSPLDKLSAADKRRINGHINSLCDAMNIDRLNKDPLWARHFVAFLLDRYDDAAGIVANVSDSNFLDLYGEAGRAWNGAAKSA